MIVHVYLRIAFVGLHESEVDSHVSIEWLKTLTKSFD